MYRRRKAKIVATLGPASSAPSMIAQLFEAGVDVFRLNFSHGAYDIHAKAVAAIRALEKEKGRPIAILQDLQGPKLRLGKFAEGSAQLRYGDPFRLDLSDQPGDQRRVHLPHPEILAAVRPGSMLLLDDGKVRLEVTAVGADFVDTKVLVQGTLSDRKGVNVPGEKLALSALTPKDRADLAFGLEQGVDWVALSFVQRPEDVAELKALVQGRAAVMAKLEKPAALEQLEEILKLADGAMIARGDLGVELPPEQVPTIQRRIAAECQRLGKPCIVATQMLESMIQAPAPTRAEVSDVAHAVYEGVDAVMLSAETAAGRHPLTAVAIMDRVITAVESDPYFREMVLDRPRKAEASGADAVVAAARQIAETVSARAIVTYTTSGATTLRVARQRPPVPIIALTPVTSVARKLCLAWGVQAVETADATGVRDMTEKATAKALEKGLAVKGDKLVITAGVPFGTPGSTNLLHIAEVG